MPNFSTPRSMAGLEDCYSTTRGHSRTTGNFITAVFNAVSASYGSVHESNHVGESRNFTGRCCAQVRLPLARALEAHGTLAASSFYFMDAESRRESKISLTRRSLLRSSARRPSRSTPTSSPRRPNRPRPTPRIRRASRKPEASRSPPVPRHEVGRTTLAEYRVPACPEVV